MYKRNVWVGVSVALLFGLSSQLMAAPPGQGPGGPGGGPGTGQPQQRYAHKGQDYILSGGKWYRPSGAQWHAVAPPPGLRLPRLPDGAREIWIGSVLYHLAAGTYYIWRTDNRVYEVVSPPPAAAQEQEYDVIAYPARGQGEEQQGRDRYECHRWAVGQSGFDPAATSTAPETGLRDRYRRALGACLQGRGYSIN